MESVEAKRPRKPEVLSPAGHWPQLEAAIRAGADAVYFGLTHFSARAKVGFTLEDLPDAMRALHKRGVRGYVTYNTLVFDTELDEAARGLAEIAKAGADAILVQDWAVVKLAREIAPSLGIYGSTQMSVTNAAGVRAARALGCDRVVLARELSLADIRKIYDETGGESACELEMFVHGALCVSYSGQCFSSEAWGGRSANRGQCAQACRLPYEMLVDGERRPLEDARYLLSPGDLYTIRQIPEIVRSGVVSLKIEGRYKDAEYVAATTAAYRRAVDEAWAEGGEDRASSDRAESDDVETTLEQVYSRGLGPYFVTGTDHQAVVRGRAPRHRGVRVGTVAAVGVDGVEIDSSIPIKPGDGIVFDAADWRSPNEPEEGGRVYEIEARRNGRVELRFANGVIAFARIRKGDWVWRSDDPAISKAIRSMEPYRRPVRVDAVARVGEPLRLTWTLESGVAVEVCSDAPLDASRNRAVTSEYLADQLGRLGDTSYVLGDLVAHVEGGPFAPPSMLNELRRRAVERLDAAHMPAGEIVVRDPAELLASLRPVPRTTDASGEPKLHLLVRTPEQLEAAIEIRPDSITLDYLDLYGVAPSLAVLKSTGIEARIASPRVLKPGEEKIAEFLRRADCAILARSVGLLELLGGRAAHAVTGDFSLNAANAISADYLLSFGLSRLTPTHDLNGAQILDLARATDPSRIEVVAYQHLPVFHTEHCVFCRFLSTGTSYKDCGRPCEKHRVELRDERGRAHPVLADVGCRNTVFGAEAQEASSHLGAWLAAGIRHFRLEFAHETAAECRAVTAAFRRALAGGNTHDLRRSLAKASPSGLTEGSLHIPGSAALRVLQ